MFKKISYILLFGYSLFTTNHAAPLVDKPGQKAPLLTQKQFDQVPFIAKIYEVDLKIGVRSLEAICGGGLLPQKLPNGEHDLYLISAAHCFTNQSGEFNKEYSQYNRMIVAGEVTNDMIEDKAVSFVVANTSIPDGKFNHYRAVEGLKKGTVQSLGDAAANDLIIAKLLPIDSLGKDFMKRLLNFKYQLDDGSAKTGDTLKVIGWGLSELSPKKSPTRAKITSMELAPNYVCENYQIKTESDGYKNYTIDSSSEWCMRSQQAYACSGDSGSVLFKLEANVMTYVGVVASGSLDSCATPMVSLFFFIVFDILILTNSFSIASNAP